MEKEGRLIETQVLVVGAGPVGLAVALELQSRGIRTLVIERNPDTTRHPKMDVTNGRSLEHFRRLGVADRIRDIAVPRENPMDVSWMTRLGEWELARFHYPDVHTQRAAIAACNDGSQPLEPYMRLSQVVLEPALRDILRESSLASIRFGWSFDSLTQDADGVTAVVRKEDGEVERIRCSLLAGCDGGNSKVREELGIECAGERNIVPFYMVHFRTPHKALMQPFGIAWHYQSPIGGTLIAQDDEEIFTLHNMVPEGVDPFSIDPAAFLRESLGIDFEFEILQANPWSPHLLLADSYGNGRVWLAGDAVHQYIPTGGYGMNTGIGDATDLGWKFAAMLQGWGGPALLPSIEQERRPVGLANREAAGANMDVRFAILDAYSEDVHRHGPTGETARAKFGALIAGLGNAENESLGLELDYRYRGSPIVVPDDSAEPDWDRLRYTPSTWPGMRAPHVFLADGDAIFDRFGPWFTLLRFDPAIDCAPILDAAWTRGVPVRLVDIDDANARRIYERDLVLIRPDQHVAWRGMAAPGDPMALVDRIRGAGA